MWIAMNMHKGNIPIGHWKQHIALPEGCEGLLFVFKTKKAAREFWGKGVILQKVEKEKGGTE